MTNIVGVEKTQMYIFFLKQHYDMFTCTCVESEPNVSVQVITFLQSWSASYS